MTNQHCFFYLYMYALYCPLDAHPTPSANTRVFVKTFQKIAHKITYCYLKIQRKIEILKLLCLPAQITHSFRKLDEVRTKMRNSTHLYFYPVKYWRPPNKCLSLKLHGGDVNEWMAVSPISVNVCTKKVLKKGRSLTCFTCADLSKKITQWSCA